MSIRRIARAHPRDGVRDQRLCHTAADAESESDIEIEADVKAAADVELASAPG